MTRIVEAEKSEKSTFRRKILVFFFLLAFTPCKAEHPVEGMELQEKETQKD